MTRLRKADTVPELRLNDPQNKGYQEATITLFPDSGDVLIDNPQMEVSRELIDSSFSALIDIIHMNAVRQGLDSYA